MKTKPLIIAILMLCGLLVYQTWFRIPGNEYVVSRGWKGGGCGLPDVLDFRGDGLRLQGDVLYAGNEPLGRIVERKYRWYADSWLDIEGEAGEVCRYWGKWAN